MDCGGESTERGVHAKASAGGAVKAEVEAGAMASGCCNVLSGQARTHDAKGSRAGGEGVPVAGSRGGHRFACVMCCHNGSMQRASMLSLTPIYIYSCASSFL